MHARIRRLQLQMIRTIPRQAVLQHIPPVAIDTAHFADVFDKAPLLHEPGHGMFHHGGRVLPQKAARLGERVGKPRGDNDIAQTDRGKHRFRKGPHIENPPIRIQRAEGR